MTEHEALIHKLEASAASERALGNHDASGSFSAKAARLRNKYNLPAPALVKETPQHKRRQVEEYWESLKPSTEVVIRVLEPGMSRTVDHVTTMEVALPMLKRESALFVRLVNGNNEFVFAPQETSPPIEKPKMFWL
jgi:hypothetical protein